MEIATLNEWFCATTLRAKLERERERERDCELMTNKCIHNNQRDFQRKNFLASLEVEGPDGGGKDNTKQNNKANMPNGHIR